MSETASKKKEFFKGFFSPWLLFIAALPIALIYSAIWNHKNGKPWNDRLYECFPVAAGIALVASLPAIAFHFWKGKKLRAYGFIASCAATPILLIALFWAWVIVFNIPLYAR